MEIRVGDTVRHIYHPWGEGVVLSIWWYGDVADAEVNWGGEVGVFIHPVENLIHAR